MIGATPSTVDARGPVDRLAGDVGALVVNGEAIVKYLQDFPEITSIAGEMLREARREFGPDAELRLECRRDPESAEECLIVLVRLSRYGADAHQRLRSIAAVFDVPLAEASGYVLLTTDYRPVAADAV